MRQNIRSIGVGSKRVYWIALLWIAWFTTGNVVARPLAECVNQEMLHSYLEPHGLTVTKDRKVHGSYYTRKATRNLIGSARPDEHGFKHASARTFLEARKKSYQSAQFLPGIDHLKLERSAMHLSGGEWFRHGSTTLFKFQRLDRPIGFDQGEETRWIRVEITSGVFHGQPISIARVRRYIKNAQP